MIDAFPLRDGVHPGAFLNVAPTKGSPEARAAYPCLAVQHAVAQRRDAFGVIDGDRAPR